MNALLPSPWCGPRAPERFDRTASLADAERNARLSLGWQLRRRRCCDHGRPEWATVARLLEPRDAAHASRRDRPATPLASCCGAVARRTPPSGGGDGERLGAADRHGPPRFPAALARLHRPDRWGPYVIADADLRCGFGASQRRGPFHRRALAVPLFGKDPLDAARERIAATLAGWGLSLAPHRRTAVRRTAVPGPVAHSARQPPPAPGGSVDPDPAGGARRPGRGTLGPGALHALHRAVAALGYADPPPLPTQGVRLRVEGAPAAWRAWVDRWHVTSTLTPPLTPEVRREYRSILAKTGRWLAHELPEIAEPAQWTRAVCARFVARVDRIAVGDVAQRRVGLAERVGRPLAAASKAGDITAVRTFLRDGQEWGWCERRFDPSLALRTPRRIKALLGPRPRTIADDVWAKLLWAGLNLEAGDLLEGPGRGGPRPGVPARPGPRPCPGLAVCRPEERRDPAPACRLYPLAARRRGQRDGH